MSVKDPQVRHLLLVMGVCSAVAKAFIGAVRHNGWPDPDAAKTDEAFAVIGPLMLSGLPERAAVQQLEDPFPSLFLDALGFCQNPELDGMGYPDEAGRLPAWAFKHIHGRLAVLPADSEFLQLVERYLSSEELKQIVVQMSKQQGSR